MFDIRHPGSPYAAWKSAVDKCLKSQYAITIEDAGLDDYALIRHWHASEQPKEFVQWYGIKYDLDRAIP